MYFAMGKFIDQVILENQLSLMVGLATDERAWEGWYLDSPQ